MVSNSAVPQLRTNVANHAAAHEVYTLQWASEFAVPTLLVTLDLRLIWANAKGWKLLEVDDGLSLEGDSLSLANPSETRTFRNFLDGLDGSPAAWIHRRTSGATCLMRAQRVEPEGFPPVAAIVIFETNSAQRYYWGDIGEFFGLTKAEVKVVKRIVDGESAVAVSESLGVSLETVRTHLRRVYNKLGVVGREQLIATVSAYRTV